MKARRSRGMLWVFALFVLCQPARSELIAERITAENFATHHVGGPDSDAGIGDWFLSNGLLCAAISDPSHESPLAPYGGVLIDLGHCGAGNDQWAVLQPILNLSGNNVVPITQILAGRDETRAWLRTRGVVSGIEIYTTYAVDDITPSALSISIRARRIGDGDRLFSIGTILLHPTGQTPAFSLLRSNLAMSIGFVYPASDRRSTLSLLGALVASDLTVLVGGDEMPPISYGFARTSTVLEEHGETNPLASFSVTGLHFTLSNALTNPLWFGGSDEAPGVFQLIQIPFMDVDSAAEFSSESRIWIGRRADVASITDQIWADAARISGQVDDPAARIHIDLASGAPVTEIRPSPDGSFAFRLPVGRYRARVVAPADRATAFEFEVADEISEQTLPPIVLGPPGSVRLPEEFIGRLVFLNENDSGPVHFNDDLLGFRIGEYDVPSGLEAPFVNLANSPIDPDRVSLPPGRYRVVAVRGPEYAALETRIEVRPGEETVLELAPLLRVAKTPGWISADLHVHSGESFDSSLPQSRQVVAFAASGTEVLVATEHDRVFDPRPAIAASRVGDQLVSITGVEVTSAFEGGDSPYSTGHLNAFPVEPEVGSYRGGAPRIEGRRLRDALVDMRAIESGPFIQLNHPRAAPGEGSDDTYFNHLGVVGDPFDPTKPLREAPNSVLTETGPTHAGRDLDYDGVELMNGASLIRYRRVRADWFSLMLQGERIVATANSDSHRQGIIVGLPRTYVQIEDPTLAGFDEDVFIQALREGRVYGSTGPLVTVRLDDAGPGDLHEASKGTLRIQVSAASWVPISEWRAYVNGELVHRAPIESGQEASIRLAFARDAFVTIEVEGPAEGLYRDALPGFTPFAFTNPIFVDADANGRFDAPGLPNDLPKTITDPDRPD